jgi:thiamine kinase-like enzyme
MAITIEQVCEQINDWRGKPLSMQAISGGLTNTNYRVEVEGQPYFVRIPGASTELLAVDRENEYLNSCAAAKAGVGPQVLYYLPEHQVMVLEFIQGRTMTREALNQPGLPARMAKAIQKLHAGPRFHTDFNMFRLTEFYLDIAGDHAVKIPDGYRDRMRIVNRIESAMSARPLATVPCNNDLLAENYIDDGEQLRLIDFEYSGNNDPTFELGNTAQEMEFDDGRIAELCRAYFGQPSEAMIARMKLNMIMSDVGWGLWAAIQAKISKIDYDFWGWAIERWSRAKAKMDSARFPTWLEAVEKG